MNYSSQDFNSLYFTLKKTIIQKTNYDIDREPSYKSSLNSIIQGVIRKNPKASNQFINSLVLNTVSNKFIDKINKSQSKTTSNNFPNLANRPLNTDPRPQSSQFPPQKPVTPQAKRGFDNIFKNNVPEMKPDMFSRQVNQSSRDNVDSSLRESPEERMNKLMKERGMLNENTNVNANAESLKRAETNLEKEKGASSKVSIANDNEFFRNLYENKIEDCNPFDTEAKKIQTIPDKPNKPDQFQDQSQANRLPEYIYEEPKRELREANDMKKVSNEIREEGKDLYRNTGFHNQRELGKLIYLDSGNIGADGSIENVQVELVEPVIIDGTCDVFIEYIGLHALKSGTTGSHIENVNLFGLKFDEIPVNVGTTNADLLGYYLFPNETFGKNDNSADSADANPGVDATTYTVKLKSNYLTTVTSGKYFKFTMSLIGLTYNAGDKYNFVKGGAAGSRLVIGLFFKKRNN